MKIAPINSFNNSTNTNFKSFHLSPKGAYELATHFVVNPELEAGFVKQVINPIEKSKTKVYYNGYTVKFISPIRKVAQSVFQSWKTDNPIATVIDLTGLFAYVRNAHYLNKLKNPTHNFYYSHPFSVIETAKNIAEDVDLVLESGNTDEGVYLSREGEKEFSMIDSKFSEILKTKFNNVLPEEEIDKKTESLLAKYPDVM